MTTFRNQHSAHVSAYRAAQAAAQQERAARELATVAAIYAAKRSDYNRFQLCNAIIDLIDDGDALAEREVLMDELGCDEDGNALDANREPITRASFGMHHPDSPSFGSALA